MAAKKKAPAGGPTKKFSVTLSFAEDDLGRIEKWASRRDTTRDVALVALTLKGLSKQDAEDRYEKNKKKAAGAVERPRAQKAVKAAKKVAKKAVKAAAKALRPAAKAVAKPAAKKKPVVKSATGGKVSKLAAKKPAKRGGVSKFAPAKPRMVQQEIPEPVVETPVEEIPAVAEA